MPGLFVFCCLVVMPGCARDPGIAAAQYDRRYGTGLFTWLSEYSPSTVVAWHVDAALVRDSDPTARILVAGPRPCAEAAREHAALVVLFGSQPNARVRDAAFDCGFALFRDSGGAAIAPR